MKLVKRIILGFFIYLVFLVVLFPASVAVSLSPLPRGIAISGVSGSIWSGSIETLTVERRQFDNVHWDIHPWALFTGKLTADVAIGSRGSAVNGKAKVAYSLAGNAAASGLRFEAPLDFLAGSGQLPFQTKVTGDISLLADTFQQGLPLCEQLTGKLFVNKANVSNRFGSYPLGDMTFLLNCHGGEVKISTDESHNSIGVSGEVTVADNMKIKVDAKIKQTPAQPEDMKQALQFLGKRDSQGYYPITFQGRIPGL